MSTGRVSREDVAVGLKFASALCALAASALLAQPLITRDGAAPPREPPARPSAPVAQAPRDAPEDASEDTVLEVSVPDEPAPGKSAPEKSAPEKSEPTARTDFQGSLLSLESRPSGATVLVDGTNHGETPITVGLQCARGKTIQIEFSLSGFASKTHEIPCPRETMVTVSARLKPNARSGKGKR